MTQIHQIFKVQFNFAGSLLLVFLGCSSTLFSQPLIFSISADWPLYRSQLIRYSPNGTFQSNDHVQGQNASGTYSLIGNIKGICKVSGTGTTVDGKYFITTGFFNNDSYFDQKLLEIDPNSSSVNVLGPPVLSIPGFGPVRDICFINAFPGVPPGIYGIRGGVELMYFPFISSSPGFLAPVSIGFFNTIATGHTAKGLTWTLCSGQPKLIVATTGAANLVKYYSCNPLNGALTYIGDIFPTAPSVFSSANCGLGWFANTNELYVNGNDPTTNFQPVYKFAQNVIAPWCPGNSSSLTANPLPFSGRNIEDFCSEL